MPTDFFQQCSQLTDHLYDLTTHWPKAIGCGVTVNNRGDDVRLQVCTPSQLAAVAPAKARKRPKRAITAFNLFSVLERQRISDECTKKPTNNELNKIIGDRWRSMTKEEKAVYSNNAEAKADKARYAKVCCSCWLVLLSLTHWQEKAIFERDSPHARSKLTGYNNFVSQERPFVAAFQLTQLQTRMGRHGGHRWKNMEAAEKELYEAVERA